MIKKFNEHINALIGRCLEFCLATAFTVLAICIEISTVAYKDSFYLEDCVTLSHILALLIFAAGIVSYFAFHGISKKKRQSSEHPRTDIFIAALYGVISGLIGGFVIFCLMKLT